MGTLQQALTSTLTPQVVAKAERDTVRQELPDRRLFDSLVRKISPGSLNRLQYLCSVARKSKSEAKQEAAKAALLEIVGRHTAPTKANPLTKDNFCLLSSYYEFFLTGKGWSDANDVYDTCVELCKADNWKMYR